MTLYVLPDGSEIASLDINGSTDAAKAWVTHPILGSILIDRDKLTEVPPPLPPIPDALAVAIGDHVFIRDYIGNDAVFICPGSCHPHPPHWAELNELAAKEGKPIVALVPDPADAAPELPYELLDGATQLRVEAVGKSVRLSLEEDDMCVSFDTDREHAPRVVGAIARAARDARRTQPTAKDGRS